MEEIKIKRLLYFILGLLTGFGISFLYGLCMICITLNKII